MSGELVTENRHAVDVPTAGKVLLDFFGRCSVVDL